MDKPLSRIFISGLLALLPIVVTLLVLLWLATTTEALLGTLVRLLVPDPLYFPGLGLLLGSAVILAVGMLLYHPLMHKLLEVIANLIQRIPIAKTIYNAVRDFADYFTVSHERERFNQVVLVRLGEHAQLLGLVTRNDFRIPGPQAAEPMVTVYLPMSFQIGGFIALLPRHAVQPINMKVEDALRYILTAGINAGIADL